MTNYNLQEFKQWLEEKPERKEGTTNWPTALKYLENGRWKLEEFIDLNGIAKNRDQVIARVIHQWTVEVDTREREREREEIPNMINIQNLLNQKYPTPESKKQVKILVIDDNYLWSGEREFLQTPPSTQLEGELDLSEFTNLERFGMSGGDTKIKITTCRLNCPRLTDLYLYYCQQLTAVKDLENSLNLTEVKIIDCPQLKVFTFLDVWKQEINQLKAQLAEYEQSETSSQTSTESTYSNLSTKITQKKQELANLRDNTRKPTKHLRKEIELLEKLHQAEQNQSQLQQKFNDLQEQLTNSQNQNEQEKQKLIQDYQKEKDKLLNDWNQTKTDLEKQITELQQENRVLQEKIKELEEALNKKDQELTKIQQEKSQLEATIQQIKQALGGNIDQTYLQELMKNKSEWERIKKQLKGKVSEEDLNKLQEDLLQVQAKEYKIKKLQEEREELKQQLLEAKIKLMPKSWVDFQARANLPDERTWWEKYRTGIYLIFGLLGLIILYGLLKKLFKEGT